MCRRWRAVASSAVHIREETGDDVDEIATVVRAAFTDHGAKVAELAAGLRTLVTPGRGASLVAEHDGRIVGHVMFTPSVLDAPRSLVEVQVLSPLSVLPSAQGQGIGTELVRQGLSRMDRDGVPLVFLEGSPHYYGRFGFLPGHELGFRKPSLRIPDEAFQVFPLASYQPSMTGTLVYAGVFWEFDSVGLRNEDPMVPDASALE